MAEMKIIAVFWKRGCSRIIAASSKPSSFGHADVDQDHRDLGLEQHLQSLATGRGDHEVLAEILQDHLIGEQLGRLVVDEEDVDLFVVHTGIQLSGAATCGLQAAIDRC